MKRYILIFFLIVCLDLQGMHFVRSGLNAKARMPRFLNRTIPCSLSVYSENIIHEPSACKDIPAMKRQAALDQLLHEQSDLLDRVSAAKKIGLLAPSVCAGSHLYLSIAVEAAAHPFFAELIRLQSGACSLATLIGFLFTKLDLARVRQEIARIKEKDAACIEKD